MHTPLCRSVRKFLLILSFFTAIPVLFSQSSSGIVSGVVTDPTGAVVSGANVSVENPVSGYSRSVTSDSAGYFLFTNLPLNSYHLTASAKGFGSIAQDAYVASSIPMALKIVLRVEGSSTSITVEAGDLLDNNPVSHTNIDRRLFDRLPLESQSSTLSSLVTLSSPGVAADSNGLFHGLGDHASNSFSIDGQPITDQQSKVFSNQIPSNAIQSIEAIPGAPPAEYGGKTSLIINVTTRSGQGATMPRGSVTASYGSFGSSTAAFDLSYGGETWGNFFEADGLNSGRFLDGPEFAVFHDKGNELNLFDRVDRTFSSRDSIHVNFNYTRSWFQTPNTYDNLGVQNIVSGGSTSTPVFGGVGNTDQHAKIGTFDIAPLYTRVIGSNAVFNFGGFIRRDGFHYYGSKNPLADLGPIQQQAISQDRSLTNAGLRTDYSISTGRNSIKAGALYQQTFLREHDPLGIVNSTFNSPCVDMLGPGANPQSGFTDPTQCAAAGLISNDPNVNPDGTFLANLLPYDLTRGGNSYKYFGHTDVKEAALYVQDQIKAGNFVVNLGIRGDFYNGLSIGRQAEPRLGVSYSVKQTGTVLRVSYARTLETPFNENLVLSSQGCANAVLNSLLNCQGGTDVVPPGYRNEFHAGFQQGFGAHLVLSGDYIWKYTHSAFDFAILGNTPIFFPINWHNSKTPGFVLHAEVPNFHHVSAFVSMSSVAARFFPPQSAGAGASVGQSGYPFRIDHDEKFNQTTHVQYQVPGKHGPWIGFNWRYDSGLNAASTPCYNVTDPNSHCGGMLLNGEPAIDLSGLTADQQFEAGLACNGVKASPTAALPNACLASQLTSSLLSIPAPGTENDDSHPSRVAPRSLFDASIGEDNLFGGDKHRISLRVSAVNLGNKVALYNFLSTFSGTHYVTPRALTAEIGFHF